MDILVKGNSRENQESVLRTLEPAFASKAFKMSETKLINITSDNQKIKVCPDSAMNEGVEAVGVALMQKMEA
ncbi:MAG: hypothetical protein QNJ18_10475 [Xenococcaceae cyanobacterium MO_167.B52]|nr:hypothetical protein [Xenococcaceae cyanobacterium MO_167.B52]